MNRIASVLLVVILFVVIPPAHAQATRTWVSGVGDDVNPCSRTAPCKTFAGAISKTLAGGEINCLDPGGFGAVTITKSITIDCSGTFGSVLNSGTNGIVINDSATAVPNSVEVILRGVSIDGAGTTPGLNGIRFFSGRSLVLENVFVQNENGSNGISIVPGGSAEFYAENVTVTDGNTGIFIQPRGATGALRAVLRNVRSQDNSGIGVTIDTTGNTAPFGTIVQIDKSSITGNSNGLFVNAPPGTTNAVVLVTETVIGNNSNNGISAAGSGARVRVGNSSIHGNANGVLISAVATVNTYGNNRLDGNGTNGSFTLPAIPQQ